MLTGSEKMKTENLCGPGFVTIQRVLRWIVERSTWKGRAREGPLGWMPNKEDLDWSGLEFSDDMWEALDENRYR